MNGSTRTASKGWQAVGEATEQCDILINDVPISAARQAGCSNAPDVPLLSQWKSAISRNYSINFVDLEIKKDVTD
jgi:hypothetical protein